jgi:hypothetical protein
LWNTVYVNAALAQLQAPGYPVFDEDTIRWERRLSVAPARRLGVAPPASVVGEGGILP